MENAPGRMVPRPFTLHWGKGLIVEEATCLGQYHQPSIQLLEFEDGSSQIRFCYYNRSGRFQRSPLLLGDDDIAGLRDALADAPRLRSLLSEMVG